MQRYLYVMRQEPHYQDVIWDWVYREELAADSMLVVDVVEGAVMKNDCGDVPGMIIPSSESWLWENPEILTSVLQGLSEARNFMTTEGPEIDPA